MGFKPWGRFYNWACLPGNICRPVTRGYHHFEEMFFAPFGLKFFRQDNVTSVRMAGNRPLLKVGSAAEHVEK